MASSRPVHASGTSATSARTGCDDRADTAKVTGVDTHAHIFKHGLQLAHARRYAPDYEACLEDYLRMLEGHGLSHGVLVQPSFLGTNNSFMVDALRAYPTRLTGVAVVKPAASAGALAELAKAGVRGIRLNLIGAALPNFTAGHWPALLASVANLGWHVEVHRVARDLPVIIGPLLSAGVDIVVDHFGRPDPALGVDDPGFRYLLSLGRSRRVWVKLSGAYRNGDANSPATGVTATAMLKGAFGVERLMWGSDWPHTQFECAVTYTSVRAQLDSWLPDPAERQVVLVDTPCQLFRLRPPQTFAAVASDTAHEEAQRSC